MKRDVSVLAVALEYDDQSMSEPIVSATGSAELARVMRRVALRYGVPIVEDSALASRLARRPERIGIGRDLYGDVAKVLARLGPLPRKR
jgi:flagellar biosynthesis protein FlhB